MLRAAAPTTERVVDGSGGDPLSLLVQQVWLPAVCSGRARVVVNPQPCKDWSDVEQYRIAPSAAAARMLVPVAPPAAVAGVLTNYRRMRGPLVRSLRLAAGTTARLHVPLGTDRLVAQVRADEPDTAVLPLQAIARALRRPKLYAALGIRTGANRKATLQLVDDSGRPAGYAKLAWSDASRRLVETETSVLRRIGGRGAALRAPALLAAGSVGGLPYLVSQPLPLSARALGPGQPMPAPHELAALCAVHRRCSVAGTSQFIALSRRLAALPESAMGPRLVASVRRLASRVTASAPDVPVSERWHGDLTPWNTARDADGRLWCWDWESSEEDAVAGLDAIHWAVSRTRQTPGGIDADTLPRAVNDARVHLWAAGLPRHDWGLVAAVYALTTAERACALAVDSGGWESVWIGQDRLTVLLGSAEALLDAVSA